MFRRPLLSQRYIASTADNKSCRMKGRTMLSQNKIVIRFAFIKSQACAYWLGTAWSPEFLHSSFTLLYPSLHYGHLLFIRSSYLTNLCRTIRNCARYLLARFVRLKYSTVLLCASRPAGLNCFN